MAEYQAYTGYRVIVVFDAYDVQGIEKKYKNHKLKLFLQKKMKQRMNELKKWRSALSNRKTQIHVATSDYTEQWAIFGQGALRKSARELFNEMNNH